MVTPPAAEFSNSGSTDAVRSRLQAVDALRAVALLGILSVNIWFFAHPQMLLGLAGTAPQTAGDQLVRFAASLIFEAKSYVIFSFLFGISFVLAWRSRSALENNVRFQGTRAERSLGAFRAGVSETRRASRRAVALIVLGLLHGLFLFAGDILLAYGILGFILIGMRRISTTAALIISGVIYSLVIGFMLIVAPVSMAMGDSTDAFAGSWAGGGAEAVASYTGTVGEWFAFQAQVYPALALGILLGQGPMALAAFLVGLVVGRARILERIAAGEFGTGRLMAIALPALGFGLTLSALAAVLSWGPPGSTVHTADMAAQLMGQSLNLAAGPFQACGYVILLVLLFRSAPAVSALLAPAGRMSLSNYVGQSVIMVLIFSAVGLGLGGELRAVAVGGVVLGIWALQLLISHLWFACFRRGPMELPVRAWTYAGGSAQPDRP